MNQEEDFIEGILNDFLLNNDHLFVKNHYYNILPLNRRIVIYQTSFIDEIGNKFAKNPRKYLIYFKNALEKIYKVSKNCPNWGLLRVGDGLHNPIMF